MQNRVLSRIGARELSEEELEIVSGGIRTKSQTVFPDFDTDCDFC